MGFIDSIPTTFLLLLPLLFTTVNVYFYNEVVNREIIALIFAMNGHQSKGKSIFCCG